MSLPPDDEPTIVPLRSPGGRSSGSSGSPGSGNALRLGTRIAEFEITGLVGEGGFGIVYLARDCVLGRNVALKEYMPSSLAARTGDATVVVRSARFEEAFHAGLRSFINEARLLARFDHPSLVKVHRFWDENGTAYMVMPFYDGITLKALLKSRGAPPDEAWLKDLLHPLTDALALLHADHCFHRDVAPDNILMLNDNEPLLLDFGAARRVIGEVTHDLTAILKPGYAPVEQYAEGPSMKQGAWTDIYALGSVVYYAIAGKPPEPSVARLIADPMVPLAVTAAGRYSDDFLRGIDNALKVRPQDRPQSIDELRSLLGLAQPRGDRTATQTASIEPTTVAAPMQASGDTTIRRPIQVEHGDVTVVREHVAAPTARKRAMWPLVTVAVGLIVVFGAVYFLLARGRGAPPRVEEAASPPVVATAPGVPPATVERPPASPPTAPAVPVRPPFSASLMLRQVLDSRDPQHAVNAAPDAAQARIGQDALRFSVSSSRAGYLYVLGLANRDTDLELLFPNALDSDNRVEGGQLRRLPGAQWSLPARGPAGSRRFVVIVSDEPRDFTQLGLRPQGAFGRFSLETGARLYGDSTDKAPLYAGKVRCEQGRNCSQSFGAAAFSIEEVAPTDAKAEPSARATEPRKAPATGANPAASVRKGQSDCTDLLQRASLGEPLSSAEQKSLKENCR